MPPVVPKPICADPKVLLLLAPPTAVCPKVGNTFGAGAGNGLVF